METLQAVAGVLEASRAIRLNPKITSWDFVISGAEIATAVNVCKRENDYLVI